MKLDGNFKSLGKFDTNVILNENHWDIYTSRQNKFRVHRATKTIPLIWLPNGFTVGGLTKIWRFPEFGQYLLIIDQLIEHLKNTFYPNCTVTKLALIKLPAGQKVLPHVDSGADLVLPHRVHLNISGDQVYFKVGDESKLLVAGECFEINNTVTHSVDHNGLTDRVNLMIDFMPNRYLVDGIKYIDANLFNFKI